MDVAVARKPTKAQKERRTHAERREEAEGRILDTAVRLLAQKGFAELTLNEVGETAGYSRALPAHYYGTKEQMMGVLAHHIVDRFNAGLRVDLDHLGRDALVAVCISYFDHAAEDPVTLRALMITFTEATSNAAVAPAIADVNASSREAFAKSIRAGQGAGEIRDDIDADTLAALILGQLRGVIALWIADQQNLDLRKLQDAFLTSLMEGIQR